MLKGTHEVSKETIRFIPNELGRVITFNVTDKTCHKHSDGYWAKVMHNGTIMDIGPFDTIEQCKKKYVETKLDIIKKLLVKYKNVLDQEVYDVLKNLTPEGALKLNSCK